MSKKIMILGASILQLPAIKKAKEMGHTVIAVDWDEQAIGFAYADVCETVSTNDERAVLACARKHDIDGIMTLASDQPMRTVAYVAREMNLVGITEETAEKATNKVKMREALAAHNVPIPQFYSVESYADYLEVTKKFPCPFIVKPADNSGSRGIFLVEDESLVEHAFHHSKKYARTGQILVEEYMRGDEVSVETLTINGDTHVVAITDKLTTGSPNFVEMGHSQPSKFTGRIKTEIESVAQRANRAIGIDNGPSHTEIMVTKEGSKVVELGARLGGDNITTHLTPLSTGVDLVECCIHIALGEPCDFHRKINMASAIRYFQVEPGTIQRISIAPDIKDISEIAFTKKAGDQVPPITSSNDRIGFVITQGSTAQEAISRCNTAMNSVEIEVRS